MRWFGFCALLVALPLATGSETAAQAEIPTLSYRVTSETDGNPGGEWTVIRARWLEVDEGASAGSLRGACPK